MNIGPVAPISGVDPPVHLIDAHAEFDAAPCRCRGVAGAHLPLQLDRTAHRVEEVGELDKEAVAGRF